MKLKLLVLLVLLVWLCCVVVQCIEHKPTPQHREAKASEQPIEDRLDVAVAAAIARFEYDAKLIKGWSDAAHTVKEGWELCTSRLEACVAQGCEIPEQGVER